MEGVVTFAVMMVVLAFVVWVVYRSSKQKDKSPKSHTYLDNRPYRSGYRGELVFQKYLYKETQPLYAASHYVGYL
jgi:hypothetical protein